MLTKHFVIGQDFEGVCVSGSVLFVYTGELEQCCDCELATDAAMEPWQRRFCILAFIAYIWFLYQCSVYEQQIQFEQDARLRLENNVLMHRTVQSNPPPAADMFLRGELLLIPTLRHCFAAIFVTVP